MRILAIDPGMKGGLCFRRDVFGIDINGAYANSPPAFMTILLPMPIEDGMVDVGKIQEWIIEYRPQVAILEKQFLGRRQSSQATIMKNYGRLTAVLDLCEVETIEVEAKEGWQKVLKLSGDKASHINYATNAGYAIPTLAPKGKKRHDGIADACCIAEAYIRRDENDED